MKQWGCGTPVTLLYHIHKALFILKRNEGFLTERFLISNQCKVMFKEKKRVSLAHSLQVVANAVAALSEISESHPNSNLLDLNPQNINKLLTALNECTEWGQIFILDCLSNYNPKDEREAQR